MKSYSRTGQSSMISSATSLPSFATINVPLLPSFAMIGVRPRSHCALPLKLPAPV